LLWTLAPQAPFFTAAGMCLLGVALMVRGKHPGTASAE
jgi:hypothetical protein